MASAWPAANSGDPSPEIPGDAAETERCGDPAQAARQSSASAASVGRRVALSIIRSPVLSVTVAKRMPANYSKSGGRFAIRVTLRGNDARSASYEGMLSRDDSSVHSNFSARCAHSLPLNFCSWSEWLALAEMVTRIKKRRAGNSGTPRIQLRLSQPICTGT